MKKRNTSRSKQMPRPVRDWRLIRRWVTGAVLLLLLGGGLTATVSWLSDPHVLPLKVVLIDGELRYLQRGDIEAEVGREIRGNFFTLDVHRVRKAAERLPWVDWVSVRRIWPDTLKMTVHEQVPLARWGKQRLVNARGQIFAPKASQLPGGLIRLSGPDTSVGEVVKRYLALRSRFGDLGLRLASMGMDARHAWKVAFDNGLGLDLGTEDTDQRLGRFIRFFPVLSRETERRPVRIDLRYVNGFAVRWEQIEEQDDGRRKSLPGRRTSSTTETVGRGQV